MSDAVPPSAAAVAADLGALEARLGYRFAAPALLRQALTHATYAFEQPAQGPNYERLEFVGDAVLDLLVAHLLLLRLPTAAEGALSPRRAQVVRREGLAQLARALDLGAAVRLGGRQPGAAANERLLAEVYEALVGAVFLDGGYDAAARVFGPQLEAAIGRSDPPRDFKTALQEVCQARGGQRPVYAVLGIDGPDHARRYRCEVRLDGRPVGAGEGGSRRVAEQQCAAAALRWLDESVAAR